MAKETEYRTTLSAIVVDAVQWSGKQEHYEKTVQLMGGPDKVYGQLNMDGSIDMMIRRNYGTQMAVVGDWLIIEERGNVYPVKPDLFNLVFQKAYRVKK